MQVGINSVINMDPLVSIVILNWNGWKDTLECLESVYQINYPRYQVILVDNHSQDESLEKIRQYCQGNVTVESKFYNYNPENKPITLMELTNDEAQRISKKTTSDDQPIQSGNPTLTLIKNDANYGFAEGNNIAMDYTQNTSDPCYILLLNNDTIADPDFLSQMVKVAQKDERVGIVGGKLLSAFNPQIIDSTGHVISWGRMVDRGHGKMDNGQYDDEVEIMGAMAAAALFRREMLKDTGLLDTSYITLGEDADLSWRAHDLGWKAKYAPSAIVYHKRGQAITRKSVIPKMTVLSLKNTAEYVSRYGSSYHKLSYMLLMTKEGLFVLTGSIMGRNETNKVEYLHTLINAYLKIFRSF